MYPKKGGGNIISQVEFTNAVVGADDNRLAKNDKIVCMILRVNCNLAASGTVIGYLPDGFKPPSMLFPSFVEGGVNFIFDLQISPQGVINAFPTNGQAFSGWLNFYLTWIVN